MRSDMQLIKSEIGNYLIEKSFCKIEREHIDDNSIDGFVLSLGDEVCLVLNIYDFQQDGYLILRLKDITSIRSSEVEQFHKELLLNGGFFSEGATVSPFDDVETLHIMLERFMKIDEIITVECEKEGRFYIGKVKKVNKSYIMFHGFDALGHWEETSQRISLNSITLVCFRSRYTDVFSTYINNR